MNTQSRGFTIVELATVIVVLGILVSITALSYREVQRNARDEKRKVDAIVLQGAIEDYYADNGDYPRLASSGNPNCSATPGNWQECWRNEIWAELSQRNYLSSVPTPETAAHRTEYNVAGDGNANYGYYSTGPNHYGIYIPLEKGSCKLGKNVPASKWHDVPFCDF